MVAGVAQVRALAAMTLKMIAAAWVMTTARKCPGIMQCPDNGFAQADQFFQARQG